MTIFNKNQDKPYIIAEIGVNHEGSIDMAKKLIDLAKEGGADAAKFQSYKADTIASVNSPAYWDKKVEPIRNQHELFKKYDLFEESDYINLFQHCESIEIDFASTPFDDNSIDYLEPLMPFYKISSSDITNIPFIRKIAKKNKPIILSTGASNYDEINNAIKEIKTFNSKELCLMHCILSYPTDNIDANLEMIKGLKEYYNDLTIGYSDHTKPDSNMLILTLAYLKGAVVLEKHFTNDKSLLGNDHFHSMNSDDLKKFHNNLNLINEVNGDKEKKCLSVEEVARTNARRSIVVSKYIEKGETLDETNLTYKRPASGISPENWDKVIGRKASKKLIPDHILQWEDFNLQQ